MEQETMEMLQAILSGVECMEKRLDSKMGAMEKRLNANVEDGIRGVKILIENDVGKRIDALFDGYKLTKALRQNCQ